MKKTIVLLIASTTFMAAIADEKPESVSKDSTKGSFYAYVDLQANEILVQPNSYRPEIEWRSFGFDEIKYPCVKGTDRVIVALNTRGSGDQWIWNYYLDKTASIIPDGYTMLSEIKGNQIPPALRSALKKYGDSPQTVEFGRVIVKAIAQDHVVEKMPPLSLPAPSPWLYKKW